MSLKKNLDLVLYGKFKDRLISGAFQPGQMIQIDEVAEYYGVSRTPVVQAIKRLENEKVLVSAPNGRVMVPEYSSKEILDICKTRYLLECYAVDEIVQRADGAFLRQLQSCEETLEAIDQSADYVQASKADLEFHRLLVSGADNGQVNDVYAVVQGRFLVVSYISIDEHLRDQGRVKVQHNILLDCLAAGDAAGAKELLKVHVMEICDQIMALRDDAPM